MYAFRTACPVSVNVDTEWLYNVLQFTAVIAATPEIESVTGSYVSRLRKMALYHAEVTHSSNVVIYYRMLTYRASMKLVYVLLHCTKAAHRLLQLLQLLVL